MLFEKRPPPTPRLPEPLTTINKPEAFRYLNNSPDFLPALPVIRCNGDYSQDCTSSSQRPRWWWCDGDGQRSSRSRNWGRNKSLITKEQVTTISMNTLFSSCRITGANNGPLFFFSPNLGHLQLAGNSWDDSHKIRRRLIRKLTSALINGTLGKSNSKYLIPLLLINRLLVFTNFEGHSYWIPLLYIFVEHQMSRRELWRCPGKDLEHGFAHRTKVQFK